MSSIETDDIEALEEEQIDGLTELILNRFDDARSARGDIFYADQSIDTWLDDAYDRYMGNNGCNNHFQLIRIKTDIVHAKVKDMTIGSIDSPFVLKPTPIPELSKEQTESIQLDIEEMLAQKLIAEGIVNQEPDGTYTPMFEAVMDGRKLQPDVAEWLQNEAKRQKKSQQYEAGSLASEACTNMTKLMLDQMYEGKWKQANIEADFDDFLYGTGCIKQEEKHLKTLKWKDGKIKEDNQKCLTWRHVPIHNCYPSPDSEDAQTGTYFIEVVNMRKQDVWACLQIDWFDKDRLKEAFAEARENVEWLSDNPEQNEGWGDDQLIDVLIHQGTVSGDTLNEYFGYDEDDDDYLDDFDFYDIEAYVLADITIGCRIIKHPYGKRTYYSSNYKSSGKNFWGIGMAMLLAKREDEMNGYETDLRNNLDKTIDPPTFYNVAMFENPNHVTDGMAEKGGLIPFNHDPSLPDGTPNTPYYQVQFQSKTNELTSLFTRAYQLSHDESGIPSILSGNSDLSGGANTFRGMKLLAATSNIIIKSYFHNKDETRIQPAMENLWYYNMLNHDDNSVKADVKVVARGVSGLMQQEIANAERLEAMPVISQLIGASSLTDTQKAKVIDYMLRETMTAGGLPAGQLMTDPEVTAEQQQAVDNIQPTTQPATPLPTIGNDNNLGGLQ